MDQEEIICVTDQGNDRLQVFDSNGRFATQMAGDAEVSKWGKMKLDSNPDMWLAQEVAQGLDREKQFWWPRAVGVDNQGRIYMVESARNRVQGYRELDPFFLGKYDGGRL